MTPRFFFHGSAAAMSGRIYRPDAYDVEVTGASALTPSGGVSRATIAPTSFKDFIRIDGASTLAEGRFADERQALALTNHEVRADQLRTRTTVMAEVKGLTVGAGPRFRAGLVRAQMHSTSPEATCEPPIQLGKDTTFEHIAIDDCGLNVVINRELFDACDTRSKLLASCCNGEFLAKHAASLFATTPDAKATGTAALPTFPRLSCKDPLYATIVQEIQWTGKPHPAAEIQGHTVVVKDFGTVFFGEILIGSMSRRLSMLRFELGSPVGGYFACAAVDKNGGWAP